MSFEPDAAPFNPLPPVVVALVLFILGIEAVFSLGARGILGGADAIGWRIEAMQEYGFFTQIFDWMVQNTAAPFEFSKRFLSYAFVHPSFASAIFASVIILAMGNMAGRVFSGFSILIIFVVSIVLGAVMFGLFAPDGSVLFGSFPGAYGLIGAYSFLMWVSLVHTGGPQMRAFRLIGVLMAIQLVFGLIFGSRPDWIADLSGFIGGFAASMVLAPGGFARVMAMIKRD
ncbi:rhomboid family protein [Rhodobacteraceae bacterium HTCC2150]|nr:rhomboid family protein [Rhodobacteraceae bacterium HTCC2150]